MDAGKSLDDRFAKLHPSFPVNTRIGILGAGPSGLSAAYALSRLGYHNVTVLEKHQTVGGMCESAEIEGRVYDLGGQVLAANSAPVLFNLAKELGSELEEMDAHKFALMDGSTGNYEDMKVADDYVSVISLTLKLQDEAKCSSRIGIHAVSDIASDSTPDFLKLHGFSSVPKSVAYGFTASGYGFVQDMPYAYIHEFTRTSMAGKIRRFQGGYMSVWKKLSESLPIKVLCNTEVLSVERSWDSVSTNIKNADGEKEVLDFDKIIISGALPFNGGRTYRSSSTSNEAEVMKLNELEKDLFGKVQTIDYYTTVFKIRGLEHIPMGFYYFGEFMEDPTTIGYPVAMQRFYADTDIFLFWSYGNSDDIKGAAVIKCATQVIKNMRGEVEKLVLQRRFKYFPHVTSEDMKGGFYEKLELELQGLQNTYYVGGLMAFELTERNSSYAMAMVCKHFANGALPKVPYVKRLLPLSSSHGARFPRELGELPGTEFPDLSTLDCYLKFWGTHAVTMNKTLYNWINDEGEIVNKRTYAELHANASHIAHKLRTSHNPVIKPGDRVLLIHPPGLDFVDAFFGCLRAKVVPVPVLPPDPLQRGGQALLKIENISKSCKAVAILSSGSYHAAVRAGSVRKWILFGKNDRKSSGRWPDLPWIHTDSWIRSSRNALGESNTADLLETGFVKSETQPDDLCFLQFTSGSTGDAKGVMITHGGLVHNIQLMRRRYKSTSRTVLVSWLPQYHDMGLIGGLFTAMVSGGSAVLFSPMTFIKNPLLWLQTITKYQATHSAGPNFAFELVVRRLESDKEKARNFDLSSMIFLMVAAEPVRPTTMKKFVELTGPFGLCQEVMAPGYGLAENCVFVRCAFGGGKPILIDWQQRVCCGYVESENSDVDVRIVDPETGKECENGKEGEIWISSPSAGVGYWGKQDLSQKTFGNVIQNHPGKKFTRTGDLGRIIDGYMFITGRIKDLIIIAGRNIYSADVEKTVETASEALRPGCCAVIGVPDEILASKGISVPESIDDQVGLVVIAEVRDGKVSGKEVVDQIQASVAEEHGVSLSAVKLIKPRTIPKTTSGKIRRFECFKQFQDGTLSLAMEPVRAKRSLLRSFTTGSCKAGQTPRHPLRDAFSPSQRVGKSKDEITEFLKGLVSEQTAIPVTKISPTEGLASYGIDSIGVVRAAQKLSDYLGVPVGAVDIFTATCISDLAAFSESLLLKSQPQLFTTPSDLPEPETEVVSHLTEASISWRLVVGFLQVLGLFYIAAMLILPAYLATSIFMKFLFIGTSPFSYLIPLAFAPLSWMLYIFLTCICISIFGNSFLQLNYALLPEISMWSMDFVKWWTLYKAQEIAGKVLAVHLRGTVFLNYWFGMLGTHVGSAVLLDSVDITDPSLVLIGDGTVIAEGAIIQSHEVKDGVLRFQPVRIGQKVAVGPYSVVQKGSVLGDEAEILPLQKTQGGKPVSRTQKPNKLQSANLLEYPEKLANLVALYHFMGIYAVGFLSSLSAAILYFLYIHLTQNSPSLQHFAFLCVAGAFHWLPAVLAAYATIVAISSNAVVFSLSIATAYVAHGLILSLLTCILTRLLDRKKELGQTQLKTWLRHRVATSCHVRFSKLLSGTEAFCVYLRLLGAKIGQHCSIRAINPVIDPSLISIGKGVHLGDFSRIIAGFYSPHGFCCQRVQVHQNSVVGSQSLILPGSVVENNVVIGALSVAPENSILQRGGIYMGSGTPVMVKNTLHALDQRIEEMDMNYKKIVGNLAGNLAITTMKVKARYFHRIGVGGKGVLKLFDNIPGLPDHKIFGAGKSYPVIIRHSNSLSADDDARIDARGAAVRILSDGGDGASLLDLTLKTGKAFYARTIADFAIWLVSRNARETFVAQTPHIREAVWNSLRHADSYAELHYYSNVCRLFRFEDGQEMYVKFKLRPVDRQIGENAGEVEPTGILPPDTGAIPRSGNDTRPLLFLADDYKRRVNSPDGVQYVFQLQFRPVPCNEVDRDASLDCTRAWDESEFPFVDVGHITIDQSLTPEEAEQLDFNPFLRCKQVDIIHATSCSQSASLDHGRSLIYEICQHIRSGQPLPTAWRAFLEQQSDAKVDFSGCPMAAALAEKPITSVTLERRWYQSLWATLPQPILQTFLPYFILGMVIFGPLNWILLMKDATKQPLHYFLPLFWVASGILAGLVCALAKWVLVGKKKEGDTILIWGKDVFMDTIWQALRTLVGEYFMEMTSGSVLFGIWMRIMGSNVEWTEGVYADSMGATLNPEMVEIEKGGCVGRESVLFGHIYEGDGAKVKFGKIRIEEGGFLGTRCVAMPGVRVESGGSLDSLSLAMKEEIIRPR